MSTPPSPAPQLLSAERRGQVIKRACLAPHISNADIDAINSAFDAQEELAAYRLLVAQELRGLLPSEPTINSDCADDWEMAIAYAASEYRSQVRAAATRLGLDLTAAASPEGGMP